ncbi:hypothetical protein VZT92_008595 [Zoarces viviparus]|uniref:Glutamate-rich protein 1 n=1 Tax=Zoarces viviparus TaxID=48416 RepID=A0AAW1FFJ4_ZOAVI
MARRKEVFQSKVLQKLYPAAPTLEQAASPPGLVDALSRTTRVKRKASQRDTAIGDAGTTQSTDNPVRRMYTVLPPPADYKTASEKSVTLPQLESRNSAEDTAEESVHDSSEEQDKEGEEQRRKRKRRRRKPALHQDSGKDGAALVSECRTGQSPAPADEGGERVSRNKKRKLKKKRHKEKLLAMGLMPRATALEFTYRKDGEEEEEEEEDDNERRAAEVSDFLWTTMQIYMSDSSLHAGERPLLAETVNNLLRDIASGCRPPSVLKRLRGLKAFVQQQQADKLEKALGELLSTSPMTAEETAAVASLFQYWITDILPMQGDKKTGLCTMHP